MPTGFTAAVADGRTTTLHDFAWACARNFGALISMREEPMDAPIPDTIEPSPYYSDKLGQAQKRLQQLHTLAPSEAQRECQQAHSRDLARWKERCDSKAIQRTRYNAMFGQVKEWIPPTDKHIGLFDFMLQQLEDSTPHEMIGCADPMPTIQRWPAWLAGAIAKAENDIRYFTKQANEEAERAQENSTWIAALRSSLTA